MSSTESEEERGRKKHRRKKHRRRDESDDVIEGDDGGAEAVAAKPGADDAAQAKEVTAEKDAKDAKDDDSDGDGERSRRRKKKKRRQRRASSSESGSPARKRKKERRKESSDDDDSESEGKKRRRRRKQKRRSPSSSRSRSRSRERRRERERRDRQRRESQRERRRSRSPEGLNPDVDRRGRPRSPIALFGDAIDSRRDRSRRTRSPSSPRGRERKPRSSNWDVSTAGASDGAGGSMPQHLMAPQAMQETRQARRIYVGNVPADMTGSDLVPFFNEKMASSGLTKWAGPCVTTAVHQGTGFVFLEMRDVDEASAMLMFDGVIFRERQLKVRRPSDYIAAPNAGPDPTANPNLYAAINGLSNIKGVVSTSVADGPHKLYLGNLPNHLGPGQVKELVEFFGELRGFHLLMDLSEANKSKGVAFLEYVDHSITEQAIAGLHGLDVCGRTLSCDVANKGKGMEAAQRVNMLPTHAGQALPTHAGGASMLPTMGAGAVGAASMGLQPLSGMPAAASAMPGATMMAAPWR